VLSFLLPLISNDEVGLHREGVRLEKHPAAERK